MYTPALTYVTLATLPLATIVLLLNVIFPEVVKLVAAVYVNTLEDVTLATAYKPLSAVPDVMLD